MKKTLTTVLILGSISSFGFDSGSKSNCELSIEGEDILTMRELKILKRKGYELLDNSETKISFSGIESYQCHSQNYQGPCGEYMELHLSNREEVNVKVHVDSFVLFAKDFKSESKARRIALRGLPSCKRFIYIPFGKTLEVNKVGGGKWDWRWSLRSVFRL